jgi:3-phosphoshikimate 1-carboxyvinyltransferase
MGARFEGADRDRLPLTIASRPPLQPFVGELALASAQVKSAILLAALGASGETRLTEPAPTRAHTERMLREFGAEVASDGDGRTIRLRGPQRLRATTVDVAADPSSAAFHAAAAALLPGSRVELTELLLDQRRARFFDVVERMGGRVRRVGGAPRGGEPVGTLVVEAGELVATDVVAAEVPDLIDELPLVAVLGACARGTTRVRGAAELRVKESDRLEALAQLGGLGVPMTVHADGLVLQGLDGRPLAGGRVETGGDHRIAMAFAVAGLCATGGVEIADPDCVGVSFPGFFAQLAALGARVEGA